MDMQVSFQVQGESCLRLLLFLFDALLGMFAGQRSHQHRARHDDGWSGDPGSAFPEPLENPGSAGWDGWFQTLEMSRIFFEILARDLFVSSRSAEELEFPVRSF